MRPIIKTLTIALVCGMLACPVTEARGRNDTQSQPQRTQQNHQPSRNNGGQKQVQRNNGGQKVQQTRNNGSQKQVQHNNRSSQPKVSQQKNQQQVKKQSNSFQPINNNFQHQGNNGKGNQNVGNIGNQRPGNNGNNSGGNIGNQRPGNNGNVGNGNQGNGRPGNGGWGNNSNNGNHNNGNVRPGNGGNNMGAGNNGNHNNGNQGMRPGNGPSNGNGSNNWHYGAPGQNHNPGHGFGGVHFGAPPRPLLPPPAPYRRPHYPTGWVYRGGGPVISTILGITIGTALNVTLNALINQGYNVTGYANDAIYVADAMQLNLLWPNATLYYGSHGGLIGSEFFYSTPYYDMNRYNLAYNRLYNAYGAPISNVALAGGGVQTTWFGANGAYVQLQFNSGVAANGTTRFFTTLSFGN